MTVQHRHATDEDICAAGVALYSRALREGRVPAGEAADLPCLLRAGLLHPDLDDTRWLCPVAPVLALPRLLHTIAEDVARQRRAEARLVEVFAPLIRIDSRRTGAQGTPTISVHSGLDRIRQTITAIMADSSGELLAIQPHISHTQAAPDSRADALTRDQEFLDRGGRIRTIYQHTLRHSPSVRARYEQLKGDAEARTLDEVTDRLLIMDRAVAFIPANAHRSLALEIRQPALVEFLATAFDRLWRLATPLYPERAAQRPPDGITPRQRAIARLLVEGHTDTVVADRLGMNVRTARVHIAKLASALGSDSRAQLGYLIATSGILDQQGGAP
nr:helix-turn-helix transcriptional regulator [Streptomyces sp. SBE_14.2]